jgi:adenosine deaminase
MSTYLMDVMCANLEFPSLKWKWEPSLPSVHVYRKILWENKYEEYYDQICNKLFPTLYEILFGEETLCLSPMGQEIVKELRDWYMTLTGVYIRIAGSTKPPHWLPHFVPDSMLLQEISYQTFINGVVASLHKHKKGIWPQILLITPVRKIENFKQAKEEVNILSSYKFQEVSFRRHDP